MDNLTPELQALIYKEVEQFAAEAEALLRKTSARNKASGKLQRSIKTSVERAKKHFEVNITTVFAGHGKIQESKTPFAWKAPAAALEKWIKTIGTSRFDYLPEGKNLQSKISRLAWAMKRSEASTRGGALGGTISGRQVGLGSAAPRGRRGRLKRVVKSQKISWFYGPYFGLWSKHRQKIYQAYFDRLPEFTAQLFDAELNNSTNHNFKKN